MSTGVKQGGCGFLASSKFVVATIPVFNEINLGIIILKLSFIFPYFFHKLCNCGFF